MSQTTNDTRITHVGTIVLPVGDQDSALEFFTGTLGFETRLDAEFAPGQRWIEVAPPGAQTSIALVPPDASRGSRSASRPKTPRPITLRCWPAASRRTPS